MFRVGLVLHIPKGRILEPCYIYKFFQYFLASDTTVKLQVTIAPKSLLPMVWQKQVEVVHNSHCKVQIRRRLSSPIPLSSVLGLLVGCLRLLRTQQIGSLMPTYHKLQACTCPKNHTIFSNLPDSVPCPNEWIHVNLTFWSWRCAKVTLILEPRSKKRIEKAHNLNQFIVFKSNDRIYKPMVIQPRTTSVESTVPKQQRAQLWQLWNLLPSKTKLLHVVEVDFIFTIFRELVGGEKALPE